MFLATTINFLVSSLNTGNSIALFIVFIRKALVLNIDYPLPERQELVNNALRNVNLVAIWASSLPVSGKLSLLDPVFIHRR